MTFRNFPTALSKLHKIIPQYAKGSRIYTKDKSYLDFTSGIGALSTGHSHPYIIKKVNEQLKKSVHLSQQVFLTHEPQIELTNKLMKIMPSPNIDNFFFTNSGSEAIDNAIKISRRYTGKTNIISMLGGFHGRTIGALSITSSNVNCKLKSQPLVPGIFFCGDFTKESLDKILTYNSDPSETAAIILEPVQGEGGIYSIPENFLKYVRKVCSENNIILIADEIQCGSGRTGEWWNISKKNIIPDMLIFGKGIASGFQLAGISSTSEIMNNLGTSYLGGTYGGNCLSVVAASATIDIFNDENILRNCNEIGKLIYDELNLIDRIKEIRQYGLMIAIEFKDYNAEEIKKIVDNLRDNNILVLLCGPKSEFIRLLPPLNITSEEVNEFIRAFKKSII